MKRNDVIVFTSNIDGLYGALGVCIQTRKKGRVYILTGRGPYNSKYNKKDFEVIDHNCGVIFNRGDSSI